MNILYFCQYYPPGNHGGSVCVRNIVSRLSESNNLLIATAYQDKYLKFDNTELLYPHYLRGILSFNLGHFSNLLRVIRKTGFMPDIILSQHQTHHFATLCGLIASRILKRNVVIRAEDIVVGPQPLSYFVRTIQANSINEITLRMARKAKYFLVVSSEVKKLLTSKGFPQSKIVINPNGVDLDRFNMPKDSRLKQKYGFDNIVTLMGSMAHADGIENLVYSIPKILEKQPKTGFLFLGSGNTLSAIKHLSRFLGISKNTIFLGSVPHEEIPWYISNSDIGIGPLRNSPENLVTIPMKIVEYMASELPVISARVSSDVLTHMYNGIVLNKINADIISNSVLYLIENPTESRKLGKNGRHTVETKFDWDGIIANLERVLIDAIET